MRYPNDRAWPGLAQLVNCRICAARHGAYEQCVDSQSTEIRRTDTADRDRLTKRDTKREAASQNASMGANSFSVINCKLFNAFVAMSGLFSLSLSLCATDVDFN